MFLTIVRNIADIRQNIVLADFCEEDTQLLQPSDCTDDKRWHMVAMTI